MINEFKDGNYFLSNFYPVDVSFDGLTFHSVEAAYQAAKLANVEDRRPFTNMTPSEAKRAGRRVDLRHDWEQVKISVMRELLFSKFLGNPHTAQLLLETQNEELVEGNTWNDTFWGVCNGYGENHLGKLLMEVRGILWEIKNVAAKTNRFALHPVKDGEQMYAAANSTEVSFKTSFIGVIQGSFCTGKPTTEWKPFMERTANEYAAERDALLHELLGGILYSAECMKQYCEEHPDAMMTPGEYVFRTNLENTTAMLRFSMGKDGPAFFIYVYKKTSLEQHMEKAKNGIVFQRCRDQEGNPLAVPDGAAIIISGHEGSGVEPTEYIVRYLDSSHIELQRNASNYIYHVLEFEDFVCRNRLVVTRP